MANGGQILVVDDDASEATLVKAVLEQDGHTVTATTAASEALEVVGRQDFDVVLTDFAMPEIDGLVLCQQLLTLRPNLRVVVVTGHARVGVAVDAMRAGACDFVIKPVEQDLLREAVARALDKRPSSAEQPSEYEGVSSTARSLGSSNTIRRVYELIGRIAPNPASVLICGETGTGKELAARALHDASGRTGRFVALNCAAVAADLIESELFGHARGAFTDARVRRDGLFVDADGGTIFLDEIGDLPIAAQPKLLRALQERVVRPVGSDREVPFDARLVCATNRDLERDVAEKRFRTDLYYRINVINIEIPPLRERAGDVIQLATQFLEQYAERAGKRAPVLSTAAAEKLLAYEWPGNVRELENCIERATVVARGSIGVDDLPENVRTCGSSRVLVPDSEEPVLPMFEVERHHFRRVLGLVHGNKARAAKVLGVDRRTLYRKLRTFGIDLNQFKPVRPQRR